MFATLELPIRDDSRHKRLQGGRACHPCRMKKVKCDGKQPCMQCKARRRKCMFVKNATDTYIRLDEPSTPNSENDSCIDITDSEGHRQQGSGEYLFANGNGSLINNLENGHQPQQRCLEPFTRTDKLVEQLADGLTLLALNQQNDHSTTGASIPPQQTKSINNSDTITPWLNFGDFVRWTPEMYPPTNYSVLLDMPSRAIQEQLISTFFSQCHHLLPTISRRLFYDQLEIKGPLITPLLLNIMYAHAAQYSSEWAHQSRSFYSRARQLVDDFLDTPRISTVMALLYLAAYNDGVWSSRGWVYSGMAVRMAMDLGLYKANYYSNEMSQFDVELRKRVLWTSYVMDQLYSVLMERPPMLTTHSISLDLPTPLPEDNDQERLAVAALTQLCRLVMIMEKVVRYFTTQNTARQTADDGNQVMNFLNEIKYWHDLLPHTLTWYDDDQYNKQNGQHQHWAIVNLHLLAFVLELSLLLCCPMITDRGFYLIESISRLVTWTLHQPHLRISITLTAFSGLLCTSTLLSHYSTKKDKHPVMESIIFRQCLMDVRQCLERIPVRDVQRFSVLVDSVLSPQDQAFGATSMDATMKAAAAAVVTATGVVGGDHDIDLLSSVSDPYFGRYSSLHRQQQQHQQQQHQQQHQNTTNYTLMMSSPLSHVLPVVTSDKKDQKNQRQMNPPSPSRPPFGLSPSSTTLSSRRSQNHHSIEPADYTFELISVADEWARSLAYEPRRMEDHGNNNT